MRFAIPFVLPLLVSACSGGDDSVSAAPPPQLAGSMSTVSWHAAGGSGAQFLARYSREELNAMLESGQSGTTRITSEARCGISLYRMRYHTAGGAGEAADANAVVAVPSGADAACNGPRPVLLYAHGTYVQKSFDMANIAGNTEARLVAAMFAAQGFILVAPNYAGYGGSSHHYHSYLDAGQQSTDMLDGLRAARASFAALGAQDSGKLFVTGYSQGGFVALATQRAMQERGAEFALTRGAALSGPYALAQFSDAVFGGAPTPGITVFLPMIVNGAQRAAAGLYNSPAEMYEAPYADWIDNLLPGEAGTGELFQTGKLPPAHLFARDSHPQAPGHEQFFGEGNLIRTTYRNQYLADMRAQPCGAEAGAPLACAPAHPLRKAAVRNDLRTFRPATPVMLCAGNGDPIVPYANTSAQAAYWRANAAAGVTELDLDRPARWNDPYRDQKLGFKAAKAALRYAADERGDNPDEAVKASYPAGLVAPFCLRAARQFFRDALR